MIPLKRLIPRTLQCSPCRLAISSVILLATSPLVAQAQTGLMNPSGAVRPVTLEQCIHTALLQNRVLQIERLNPPIARSSLIASYGYYDPIFLADVRDESTADRGGFDPADFSRDAIYSADSDVARLGLTGVLPFGLSYVISGSYAHSEGFRNGLDFDSYSLIGDVSVRQPLLRDFWIDQGRTTIRINRKNLKITELGVRYVAMDVINQVHQAYYELSYALGERRIREDLLETRRQLLANVRRRIEMGTLTVLDERLAEAQVANVEADLTVTENAVALVGNQLRLLLGESWTNSIGVQLVPADALTALPEEFDLPEHWRHGLVHRPDLEQFRKNVETADIDLRFRRNQLFPALDVIAGYGRKGASTSQTIPPIQPSASLSDAFTQFEDGTAPSEMVGIIFSIPLGLTAERGNYRASKHLKAQAELRVKQFEDQVLREIADAVHTARFSLERVKRAVRARELSEAALAAEEQKLAGGKSTLFFVLQLQGDLASARFAELRSQADYNQALAQLSFADASLLDRQMVNVEFE